MAEFEKVSKSAQDADLRKWAGEKLPTLREHLKMAQATHGAVAGGSAPRAPAKPATTAK